MNNAKPTFKEVAASRRFIPAWVLLIAVIAAGGIAVIALPHLLALIEAGVLVVVIIFIFMALYRAAVSESAAIEDRSELKSLRAAIEDSFVVYTADFRVISFNEAAEKIFKLNAAQVVGHVLSPRDAEQNEWRALAQVIFPSLAPRVVPQSGEGEMPQVVDVSLTDPELELRVATAPVLGENGHTQAFIKIIRDRTPQLSALRAKTEFLTIASHQLRGPVTDISWALQSLADATELSETNKTIVETANAAAQNLLRRIEDLLSIARMEDGRVGYQFESIDLAQYLNTTLAGILPAARKAGIKIYFDRPSTPLPQVMIDKKQLAIAITNILENAIRYNVENGEVTVKLDQMTDKPYLVVSVRDTGIGVPSDALPKLFTKFYRADNAMRAQTEGSGLGLYITKNIVEAHGGKIWAESELGRGTTISFAIPTDPSLVPKHEVSMADLV